MTVQVSPDIRFDRQIAGGGTTRRYAAKVIARCLGQGQRRYGGAK